MNELEQAVMESRRESAQNEIRAKHNELESRRWFGRKHYFPYHSEKYIVMVKLAEKLLID